MRELGKGLQALGVYLLHIRKQLFELCEVSLGYILIQHLEQRLILLIELRRPADRGNKLLDLLRIAVEHLHELIYIERGEGAHKPLNVREHTLNALRAELNVVRTERAYRRKRHRDKHHVAELKVLCLRGEGIFAAAERRAEGYAELRQTEAFVHARHSGKENKLPRAVAQKHAVGSFDLGENVVGQYHSAQKQHRAGYLIARGGGLERGLCPYRYADLAAFSGKLRALYLLSVERIADGNFHGRQVAARAGIVKIRGVHVPIKPLAVSYGLCKGLDVADILKICLILDAHLRHIGVQPVGDADLLDLAVGSDVNIHRFLLIDCGVGIELILRSRRGLGRGHGSLVPAFFPAARQ